MRIFMTGVTGALGAHFALTLLEQNDFELCCLVRADSVSEAYLRLEESLRVYDPAFSLVHFQNRIRVIPGSVSLPFLGMSEKEWKHEASQTDAVVHAAALTNLLARFSSAKRVNLEGTRELIRFAEATISRRLLHVSTYSVCGDKLFIPGFRFHEEDWDIGQAFPHMPYQESKFLAEAEVRKSNCVWTIVRPGHIFGDSKTGRTFFHGLDGGSFFWDTLKSARDFGCSFVSDFFFDITPVNYVSEAMLSFLLHKDLGTFHLCQKEALRFEEVLDIMIRLGIPVQKMSIESYRGLLTKGTLRWNGKQHSSLTTQVVSRWFHLKKLKLEASGRVDTTRTRNILEPRGLIAPSTDEALLSIYFAKPSQAHQKQKRKGCNLQREIPHSVSSNH